MLGRKWQPLPVLKYRGLVTLFVVCAPAMNNSITNIIVSPNCIRASLHHFNNEISRNQCIQLTISVNLHHEKSQVIFNSLQNRITMQCMSVLLCHICSVQWTLSCIDSGLIDCTMLMLQGGYSFYPIVLFAHSQSDGSGTWIHDQCLIPLDGLVTYDFINVMCC